MTGAPTLPCQSKPPFRQRADSPANAEMEKNPGVQSTYTTMLHGNLVVTCCALEETDEVDEIALRSQYRAPQRGVPTLATLTDAIQQRDSTTLPAHRPRRPSRRRGRGGNFDANGPLTGRLEPAKSRKVGVSLAWQGLDDPDLPARVDVAAPRHKDRPAHHDIPSLRT